MLLLSVAAVAKGLRHQLSLHADIQYNFDKRQAVEYMWLERRVVVKF